MVSITSGAWPLSEVGMAVEDKGYLQRFYNFAGNSVKTFKNKINILFYLIKLYDILMSITLLCYCVFSSIIIALASFIFWKILWYLYDHIKKYLKKKTDSNQTVTVEEESISQNQTITLGISQQLAEFGRKTKARLSREQGKCYHFF
jgi:hypothetical protein